MKLRGFLNDPNEWFIGHDEIIEVIRAQAWEMDRTGIVPGEIIAFVCLPGHRIRYHLLAEKDVGRGGIQDVN